jgi:hypothetical protein
MRPLWPRRRVRGADPRFAQLALNLELSEVFPLSPRGTWRRKKWKIQAQGLTQERIRATFQACTVSSLVRVIMQGSQQDPSQSQEPDGPRADARLLKLIWGVSVLAFMTILTIKDVPLDVVLPLVSLLPKPDDFDIPDENPPQARR